MYKPPSYRTDGVRSIKSETFGEHLTCGHVIVYRDNVASIEGCRLALILKDVGTSLCLSFRTQVPGRVLSCLDALCFQQG